MKKILKIIAKTIKIILLTFGVVVAVLILLYFIPVKFVVQPEDIDYEKEFYIVYFITPYSTDSGCYIYNIEDDSTVCLVELTGADPRKDISGYICRCELTKFVIYGSLETDGKNYYLNSDKWDVLEKIDGGTHEKYLTVYDYIDLDDY
ncbi:MAG: hypothetical protein NC205_03275 [Prevotella sp.]|nr:hypothetical protein [Alistipes senegalensis]MCM1357589.1 hypothetical protein [Prevotella sp.]MCM1473754.1 hypothetical protein [Muribaculaceae bacterium]